MCLVFCGDYIIPYIGSVLLFYFGFSIKKFGFLGARSLRNIISDWKIVLAIIENEQSEVYQNLLKDARHLRLLQRGSQLYAALDILWRENGSYIGATEAVANALTQEHFSMSTRKWSGVNVMTIHKSKGKEFDAVIVYEGRYQNRIISKPERREQATLNLRVAVTRAKEHTYILTHNDDPCSLL